MGTILRKKSFHLEEGSDSLVSKVFIQLSPVVLEPRFLNEMLGQLNATLCSENVERYFRN